MLSSSLRHKREEDIEKYNIHDDTRSESDTSTLLENVRLSPSSEVSRGHTRINARVISDMIIGLSDGLTVPFALTAGLSAIGSTRIVVYGGMAELCAGAISMGLGGYLGSKSEEQSYRTTAKRATTMLEQYPSSTVQTAVESVFEPYDIPTDTLKSLSLHLQKSPRAIDFVMQFQHRCEEPESTRALTCALTIAGGYFVGGFLPLLPYFFVGADDVSFAFLVSCGVMVIALFVFGLAKTCHLSENTGRRRLLEATAGGLQMVFVGGIAAACAMGLVRAFNALAGA